MTRRLPTRRECLTLIARSRRNILKTYALQIGACVVGALDVQNLLDNGERYEIAFIGVTLTAMCAWSFVTAARSRVQLRRSMADLQQAVDEGLV